MQHELNYLSHKANIEKLGKERLNIQKNKDSFGYSVLEEQLRYLAPFLRSSSSWITIGDLNGLEANYLLNKKQSATATDISDHFLQIAFNEGLINAYEAVNVERIQFQDNSFDYCLCKESYHHFPRAYLGLYEMIRICKKATILIEPIDPLLKMPLLLFAKNILDKWSPQLINKIWNNRFSFESVGNYVFKLSEREVEKIAMGLGLPCIAFKGMNVSYNPIPKDSWESKSSKKLIWKHNKVIYFKNILSLLGIIPYNVLNAVVFKSDPSIEVREELKRLGYSIVDLPKNPYLNP